MRILTRYVLREFLVPLGYCLAGFFSIFVLFDLFGSFSRMAAAKISVTTALLYFCGYLAPYCQYIVPAALMLATLYTMWSFCRHSEITAMRASGVSFLAIVRPLLSVALLLAFATTWVNEVFVPARAQWAAQMKSEQFDPARMKLADNVGYRNADGCRTWNIDVLETVDASKIAGVKVTVDRPAGGSRLMNITAARAEYLDGEWWFFGARVQHYDVNGREVATPTPELDALPCRCFSEFDERPGDFILQNRPWKFNSVADRLRYLRTHPNLSAATRRDYTYDTWAQIMAPWAALIITLFAIPAGIASGRQSVFKGILGALGLFFAYYGFTIAMMVVAKSGWLPPVLAAVLPAIVFLFLGVRSFLKQR